MTESIVIENPKQGKKHKKINHIKIQVVPDLKADTAVEIVKEQTDSKAELTTDNLKTFYKLYQTVESHKAQVIKP